MKLKTNSKGVVDFIDISLGRATVCCKLLLFVIFLILIFPNTLAADEYKPYLHKAAVPEHPKVKLYGSYSTNLFPGAATYSYPIEVPKGTNGLQPSLSLSYNSQTVKQRPGILGTGWSKTENYIDRDINSSVSDTTDDKFKLVLGGSAYDLVYDSTDTYYHTQIESYLKIQNFSTYWLITSRDGTEYRFGYNDDSRLAGNNGQSYNIRWSLDQVEDTHGNKIYYTYQENPFSGDNGTVYLSEIKYNNDQKRKINFTYESRLDTRRVFEQGNDVNYTRRLSEINIYFENSLVRKYEIDYDYLNNENTLSVPANISYYGNDGTSKLHTVGFDYFESTTGYGKNTTIWNVPMLFSDESIGDYGVRLADINNDGFIDIFKGFDNNRSIWINSKNGSWTKSTTWTLPVDFIDSNNKDIGVRLVDFNKDGFVDLLQGTQVGSNIKKAWRNNGTGFVDVSSSMKPPVYFTLQDGKDWGVRFGDINGDGYTDMVQHFSDSAAGTYKAVYLNNKSNGWIESSAIWDHPVYYINENKDFGTRLVDFNGDGLADIIQGLDVTGFPDRKRAWINTGNGWNEINGIWAPPVYFRTNAKDDHGVRLADVNGDGLIDLLEDFANGTADVSSAYINTGHGWISSSTWKSPEPFTKDGLNIGRRIADVDGDGFADILVGYKNNSITYHHTWTKNATIPYLLKVITNEFGGVTNVTYMDSTSLNNTGDDSLSDIGFNIKVVDFIRTNNSMNSSFNVVALTNYSYFSGSYDYPTNEFRGFNMVNESLPDGTLVNHYFYQDDALKGKEYETETFDSSGDRYSAEKKNYRSVLNNSYYKIYVDSVLSYSYDSVSSNPNVVNISYTYNSHGDVIQKYYHGDVDVTGDEKKEVYTYWYNSTNWIMGKVRRYLLYDPTYLVKYTKYSYDDRINKGPLNLGELTRVEYWNSNGSNPVVKYDYDNFGNKISEIDALGRETKFVYSLRDETNTYTDQIINALGHSIDYSYDVGTGNLDWEEKNHIKKYYYYDVFGRISKEVMPYDSYSLPTTSYSYSFDGNAPESVMVSKRFGSNETMDTYYFYDGFSNLVQVRSPGDDDQQVIKDIYYDELGRVSAESNPYFADVSSVLSVPASSKYTNYTYDTLGRVTRVKNPDGTNKSVTFDHYNVTTYDENSHKKVYVLDALGRITHVYEYNNDPILNDNSETRYNTSYYYDVMDNLVLIEDEKGNEFIFAFDSLGRKGRMDDPDLGVWRYYYDKNGNLIKQVDNRGVEVNLTYDELDRVVNKSTNDSVIGFTYDIQYLGTLSRIVKDDLEYNYSYDKRYRIIEEKAKLDGTWFDTGYTYDSMDRILTESLSDVGAVGYDYNFQGLIEEIPGFVNLTHYNAFGNPLNRSMVNNLKMEYSYDSDNGRLTDITTGSIQDMDYSYDSVGNVVMINDTVNNRKQTMTYDYLDRLVNASINDSHYRYVYDELGNMLKIVKDFNNSTRLIYGGAKAHAHYSVVEDGAGVMVYKITETDTDSKSKSVEFYLVNEKNQEITNVSWTVDWGDGNTNISSGINLSVGANEKITVNYTYANAGDYDINVSASWGNYTDRTTLLSVKFGVRADSLTLLHQNVTNTTLEFKVRNDVEESVTGINWSCDNGLNSSFAFNLSGNETIFIIIGSNYSTAGWKSLRCNVNSTNGNDYKSINFNVKDVEIEDYNSTIIAGDKRMINFLVKNYFSTQNVNWQVKSDGQTFTGSLTLGGGNSSVVSQQVNYTFPGAKKVVVNVSTGTNSDNYTEHFKLKGIEIEDYLMENVTFSDRIFGYTVRNYWADNLTLKWNLTDPDVSSNNDSVLDYNETLLVFIEENFTSSDDLSPTFFIYNDSNFNATFTDRIVMSLLKLVSHTALYQDVANTIIELVARNNIETLDVGWQFESGQQNLSSTQTVSLNNSQDVFIFINVNYTSAGAYATNATINSTTYRDSLAGGVVA